MEYWWWKIRKIQLVKLKVEILFWISHSLVTQVLSTRMMPVTWLFKKNGTLRQKIWKSRMPYAHCGVISWNTGVYLLIVVFNFRLKSGQFIHNSFSFRDYSRNPNGKSSNGVWLPSIKEMPQYLQIDANLTMRNEDFDSERAEFWRYLTEKYSLWDTQRAFIGSLIDIHK